MKMYEKRYENIFTSERSLKKCDFNKISTDIGLNAVEYRDLFRKAVITYERTVFTSFVKIMWLRGRFLYDGMPRIRRRRNGAHLDGAYGVFIRHHVGVNSAEFTTGFLDIVSTYLYDFFPNFEVMNPFEDVMEYPYEHIRFSHLFLVYQMTERMELIEYAEKNKVMYDEFADFVLNYVYSLNEEKGEEWYRVGWKYDRSHPYVRNIKGIIPYEEKVKTDYIRKGAI